MKIHRAKILGFFLLLAGLALCGAGLWLLLSPAQYQAVARLQLDYPKSSEPHGYDEDFIPIETEVIESETVLGKVVRNLNLNDQWGKKNAGGSQLKTDQIVLLLKKRVKVEAIPHTPYMDISFTSKDPGEAAEIANAIAEVYREFRFEQWRQVAIHEIRVLTELYQKDEEQIHAVQTNVERLRVECKITNDIPPPQLQPEHNSALPGQPYWEEKRKLETMLDFHKLLAAKIEASKLDLKIPRISPFKIVDPATPQKSPIGPNRLLGALLFVTGFFLSVGGFLLLKPSRRPSD
jgi:uncharacterized protein involved in exopolysaccharide biosynthesis